MPEPTWSLVYQLMTGRPGEGLVATPGRFDGTFSGFLAGVFGGSGGGGGAAQPRVLGGIFGAEKQAPSPYAKAW